MTRLRGALLWAVGSVPSILAMGCGSTEPGSPINAADTGPSDSVAAGPGDASTNVVSDTGSSLPTDGPNGASMDVQVARDTGSAQEGSSGACGLDSQSLTCGEPAPCRPLVQGGTIKGAPPAAMGGAITPGTYELVSWIDYYTVLFSEPPPLGITRVLTSTDMRSTVESSGSRLVFVGPYTIVDKSISWNVTCPAELAGPTTYAYTATPNELTLFQPQGSATYVLVHRRVQ